MGAMMGIKTKALLSLLVLALAGSLVYWAAHPRPVSSAHAPRPSKWGSTKDHMKTLLDAPMIEKQDHAGYAEIVDNAIEPPLEDDEARLTHEARRALVDLLSTYLEALTAATPDKYMAIADSEPTEWIKPTDSAWKTIGPRYEYVYGRPPDRNDPRGVLRDLLASDRFADGRRYVRIGTGKRGLRVLVAFTRTAGNLDYPIIAARDGYDEYEYWTKGGAHGLRFREPTRTAHGIAKRHHGVLYAQASVVLVSEEGRPAVWHSTWYWDPNENRWLNHAYWGEGYYTDALVTYY